MRIIDNKLYIEYAEMIQSGVAEGTLKSATQRNSVNWKFINDPEDKRKVLVSYEDLKKEYKDKVEARYGNPYEYLAKMPLRGMVKYDSKAEQYYMQYRYSPENGTEAMLPLPIEHVKKYTWAASWLNMLKEFNEDKKTLKSLLNLTLDQFYKHLFELLKTDNIDLPTSYRRLAEARKKYEAEGYDSLIDWRFGKKLAAKVKDEVSSSMLLEMIAHHNQFDDVFISLQYNKWAKDNDYKTIVPATVGEWRRKYAYKLVMYREGNAALKGKYLPQVKGMRPSFPLALLESDDNELDLLYLEVDREKGDKHSARYVAIVVVDSFNDYVLGYAYAQELKKELIKEAYRNAMHHIKELTGNWYLPHETKTDNWAIAYAKPFYDNLGHHFKTPVGSKNRGYIENFFGSKHWKLAMKWGADNYTGNNITAKNRGVNMDALANHKKERPLVGKESVAQLENFFHRLRVMPDSSGFSKQHQWLEAWKNLDDSKKRLITDEQYLLKVGEQHLSKNGELPSLTNRGMEIQLNNQKFSYDIVGGLPTEHIGKKLHLYYDPLDMNKVLLTDNNTVRLMGESATFHSKAMADHTEGSRTALNKVFDAKRAAVERIVSDSERRKNVLESAAFAAETALKEGIMTKEIKQKAERIMLETHTEHKEYNAYDLM